MAFARIRNFFSGIYLLLLIATVCSAPAAKSTDAVAQQLAQLSHNEKMNALAKELERLQQESKNTKNGDFTIGEVEPVKQHIIPANSKKGREEIQPDGVFLDGPVDVKSRAIGWQPLRRNTKPELSLEFNDKVDIRQEVLDTIEKHILDDLDAVKEYGIRPESILEDLREKELRRKGQYLQQFEK